MYVNIASPVPYNINGAFSSRLVVFCLHENALASLGHHADVAGNHTRVESFLRRRLFGGFRTYIAQVERVGSDGNTQEVPQLSRTASCARLRGT